MSEDKSTINRNTLLVVIGLILCAGTLMKIASG